MALSIKIHQELSDYTQDSQSQKLRIWTTDAVDVTPAVFILQRVLNKRTNKTDNTFAAIATPAQLEDLQENTPGPGTTYYRASEITLVGRVPEDLAVIFQSIVYEVRSLLRDLQAQQALTPNGSFIVTPTSVTAST